MGYAILENFSDIKVKVGDYWGQNEKINICEKGPYYGISYHEESGKILRRPIHTPLEEMDFSSDVTGITMEKDGIPISPIWNAEGTSYDFAWSTGFTIHDGEVDDYGITSEIHDLVKACGPDWTCCFESCSSSFLNVIHYAETECFLIAIRNNKTGLFVQPRKIRDISETYDVSIPHDMTKYNPDEIAEMIGIKGVLIHLGNGELFKFETKWFKFLSEVQKQLDEETEWIKLVVNKQAEIAINTFPKHYDIDSFIEFSENYDEWLSSITKEVSSVVMDNMKMSDDEFDMIVHRLFGKDKLLKMVAFSMRKKENVVEFINNWALNHQLSIVKRVMKYAQLHKN